MTLMQVEKRVKVLEKAMHKIARSQRNVTRNWYRTQAGRFANDRDFDEIVSLGQAYRKSQKPATHTKRA